MSLQILLAELAMAPSMPRAACKGRDGFDADKRSDPKVAAAVEVCRRCPELARCRDWVDGLPKAQRPAGVVAGEFVAPHRVRSYAKATTAKPAASKPRRPTKADLAAQWLAEYLATHGPSTGRDILAAAERAGFKRGTVFGAREALGVIAPPRLGLKAGESPTWRLPETASGRPRSDEIPSDDPTPAQARKGA